MKTRPLLLTCFIVSLLFSCNQTAVYSNFDRDFTNNRWEKTDKKTYDFSIDDETKQYNIILKFSHVYDYQFANVPIDIKITDPAGKEEKFTVDLKIKDDSGKQLAECAGDICDLSVKIKDNVTLAKGNYNITVSNSFDGPYLPNVLGVGLNVDIAK
ncbi:hypothetical protein [Flavobacterium sp.]|uniref:hypothetical protein n=1 Tax=Flavobacterium sp. TaxID=239 RepID=UPI003D6A0796